MPVKGTVRLRTGSMMLFHMCGGDQVDVGAVLSARREIRPPSASLSQNRDLQLGPRSITLKEIASAPGPERTHGPARAGRQARRRRPDGASLSTTQNTTNHPAGLFLPGGPYLNRHKMPVVYHALKPNGPIPIPTLGSP